MKTTLDLPADLVKEVKLRAVHEDKKLKDAVAELLRDGLAAAPVDSATRLNVDKATLERRAGMTRKFISGEWAVELAGFEDANDAHAASKFHNPDAGF